MFGGAPDEGPPVGLVPPVPSRAAILPGAAPLGENGCVGSALRAPFAADAAPGSLFPKEAPMVGWRRIRWDERARCIVRVLEAQRPSNEVLDRSFWDGYEAAVADAARGIQLLADEEEDDGDPRRCPHGVI